MWCVSSLILCKKKGIYGKIKVIGIIYEGKQKETKQIKENN